MSRSGRTQPGRGCGTWGARRSRLTNDATAQVNQIRDLLECAWPAVLAASGSPFRSMTWRAALAMVLDRCAGDLGRVRRLGSARFEAAVRRSCHGGCDPPVPADRAGRVRRPV
jgi:transposase